MRPVVAPLIFGIALALGCNGATTSGGAKRKADAAEEPEPEPEPEPTPKPDAAVAPPADGAAAAPDVAIITADAPVVVAPTAPGPDKIVTAFSGTPVYFVGSMDNKRIVDVPVEFPEASLLYKTVTLKLALRCPAAGCDFWDRRAFLGVVRKVGDKESVTEILRFMTPYRVGASWTLDVTGLRPLLSGPVTLRVFIDTWVGPGNAQGSGWLVDASFELVGGMPARRPIAVIPLWDETKFDYGDPAKPVSAAVIDRSITLPAEAGQVELRSFITGHGQGNRDNCAEFCRRMHYFSVDGARIERLLWRDDCATTAVKGQAGSFQYPRAGWCPGADVQPWVADVSAMAQAGKPITVHYEVQAYENTCRPDSPMCAGCALRTGCAYDNGNHTNPFYVLSAALIVYAH
jgi:hypothetical protein